MARRYAGDVGVTLEEARADLEFQGTHALVVERVMERFPGMYSHGGIDDGHRSGWIGIQGPLPDGIEELVPAEYRGQIRFRSGYALDTRERAQALTAVMDALRGLDVEISQAVVGPRTGVAEVEAVMPRGLEIRRAGQLVEQAVGNVTSVEITAIEPIERAEFTPHHRRTVIPCSCR